MAIKKFNVNSIVPGSIGSVALDAQVLSSAGSTPKITAIAVTDSSYNTLDDTAVNVAGGYILITGTGFASGCQVIVGSQSASSVQFISSTTVRAQIPAQTAGTYIVYLINSDGGVAIRVNGLNYSGTPTWVTGNNLPTQATDENISIQLSATGAASYATAAGSTLPNGLTLTSGGLLSGVITGLSVDTVYNFSIAAIDSELQDTVRAFTITITAGDAYWAYNSLLLRADNNAVTFVNDASANSYSLTVNGDVRPNNFNPYTPGYYSNYFDGTGDYFTTPYSTSTVQWWVTDYTIEMWIYNAANKQSGDLGIPTQVAYGDPAANVTYWAFGTNGTGRLYFYYFNGNPVTNAASPVGTTVPLNTWAHVAMVYNNTTGFITGYINGVSAFSVAKSGTPQAPSGYTLNIGSTIGITYNGYISNLKIVRGDILYTSNFTPSSIPLTTDANTSLLTCQSNRFIDKSTNNFAITAYGSTSISGLIPFTPNIAYTTQGSGYFDGSGDYVSISSGMNVGTNDFTLETWILPTAWTSENGSIFSTRPSNSTANATDVWALGVNNTGYPYVYSGAFQIQGSAGQIVLNRWTHLAVTRSGSTMRLFVNGALVQTSTSLQNYTVSTAAIGANTNGSEPFTGLIAELRLVVGAAVYTSSFTPPVEPLTAITNTRLLTLTTNQSPDNSRFIDSSGRNLQVNRVGNATQGSFSPYGSHWSNYFDGNGDYLTLNSSAALGLGSSDFTLELWAYFDNASATNDQPFYTNITASGYLSNTFWFGKAANSSGKVAFFVYNYSSSTYFITEPTLPPENQWVHYALVRNGNTFTIYRNGTSTVSSTFSGAVTGSTSPGIIARALDGVATDMFSGYISNFRLVKGAAVYTTSFTPSTTPLTAIAGTSLLTCQNNRFTDNSVNNFTVTRNGDTRITKFSPFKPSVGYTTASNGGSSYFDGSGDGILLPATDAATFGTGDYTVELWLNLTSSTQYYPQAFNLSTADTNAASPMAIFFQDGPLSYRFGIKLGSDNIITGYTQSNFYNTWRHIAISRTGTSARVFIDGVLVTTLTDSVNYSGAYRIRSGYFINESGTFYMAGYISDIRVVKGTALYTSNFTPPAAPVARTGETTVLLKHTGSGVVDDTGQNNLETVGNARISNAVKKYGTGSMYFDSTGDNLLIPYNPLLVLKRDFTIELWFYAVAKIDYNMILNFGGGEGIAWASYELVNNADGINFAASSANSGYDIGSELGSTGRIGTITLNTWNHLAVTRSGNVYRGFVNGVQGYTQTLSLTPYDTGTRGLAIGSNYSTTWGSGTPANVVNGYIDDLRITQGVARYTSNFTPPARLTSR